MCVADREDIIRNELIKGSVGLAPIADKMRYLQ